MKIGFKTALLAAGASLALAAFTPASAEDMSGLKQQLEAMKERLAKLEADRADKRRVASAAAVEAGDKPRSWKLPGTNTSMSIGGFVKAQFTWDFSGGGSSSVALGGGAASNASGSNADNRLNGGHWAFSAKQSRLFFATWTPTDWGELQTYVEVDFQSATTAYDGTSQLTDQLRLRHAYGTLGPVLAGQTWSTFVMPFAFPDTLDDGGPAGVPGNRQVQLRYSHNLHSWLPGLVFTISAEDPRGARIFQPSVNTARGIGAVPFAGGNQPWPDVIARLDYTHPQGQIAVAGMIRQVNADTGGVNALSRSGRDIGWGVNTAFRWTPTPQIILSGNIVVGKGIGKYMVGGATGADDATVRNGIMCNNTCQGASDVQTIFAVGGAGGLSWRITDTITWTVAGGYFWQDAQAGRSGAVASREIQGAKDTFWSAETNLQWSPVSTVTFGIGYTYWFVGAVATPTAGTISGGVFTGVADNHNQHRLYLTARYRF